jgi:hypothetical protein
LTEAQRAKLGFWVRVALGIVGLGALVWLVNNAGPAAVLAVMREGIAWLPLMMLLELARIGCETIGCYLAFGERARDIPRWTLFRANLMGQSLSHFAPAPRLVNETVKASTIAPYTGVAAAAAVGFTLQAATLIAIGFFSIPCGIAIYSLEGASLWMWAMIIHGIVLVASGVGLRLAARADGIGLWVARVFPRTSSGTAAFAGQARSVGVLALGPAIALTGNRIFQVLQFLVAGHAVGIDAGLAHAFAVQGVNLVASAVGVLVPGGLGTTDGAFALSATMLGTTLERATSLALMVRCNQLIWLLIGSITLVAGGRAPMKTTNQS